MTIDGDQLIEWGHKPGPGFAGLLSTAKEARAKGMPMWEVCQLLEGYKPPPPPPPMPTIALHALSVTPAWHFNMDTPQNPTEVDNQLAVARHMDVLMRTPTVVAGAIMPDACPMGNMERELGTIPVGGVVAAKDAIHPGMHSNDICCSMAYTNLGRVNPKAVLDAAQVITHFGPGGRPRGAQWPMPAFVGGAFDSNIMLAPFKSLAMEHFGTQGDGNHFFYVGRHSEDTVIVTHHGSRGPGAKLYKTGMNIAKNFKRKLCPEIADHNAWIPMDTIEGETYWQALQIIRLWTRESHYAIHNHVMDAVPGAGRLFRFWNEHNFVFKRDDGLFYHAKGATPAYPGFSMDDVGVTLIPLNMAEPILIAKGLNEPRGLGFAPHGAGRHQSRTAYMRGHAGRRLDEIVEEQTWGIDARFYNGVPDISELPGAYKQANTIRAQIEAFGLADVIDEIKPYGCIMAGAYRRGKEWKR